MSPGHRPAAPPATPPAGRPNPWRAVRRYLPFATSGLQTLLRYRSILLINGITAAASAAVQIFLWRAVYADAPGGGPGGFDRDGITTYLLLAQVLHLLHANRVDDEVSSEIYRGDIAVALTRPVSYPVVRFFAAVPVVLVNAALVAVPVLALFTVVLPIHLPTPADAALFAVATTVSAVIAYAINLLVGMSGFVTTNTWGVRLVKESVVAFFAGRLVPIALMPGGLAAVASALPFAGMVDTPLRLALGRYSGAGEAAALIGRQLLWAAVLLAVCALAWRAAVRRLEVLGG
ncbi:ABC transporter permease [Allostreptomyces psammosilenae]|uniref:ABC-2 type transport system permease protein n=1 Tax=Allostreptomyces psammosilenae TaxID=1892865 RepID=A0A853A134_9ACTN|nr:ABC-2 family transporter protein [Allostreptomyces psammosilenae]NYI04212.1 ABC-2 type transport system permease protein [Allostreptomyces psammosilenae]